MSAPSRVIDAHVHLYDPHAVRYDWMRAQPRLDSPHPPARYWAEAEPAGIGAAVWVEVNAGEGEYLREARFVGDWVAGDPRLLGMVASVPSDPAAGRRADVSRFDALPAMVGVRTLIETHAAAPGWSSSDAFVAEVDRITRGAAGRRAFDLCIRAGQLREVAELVARLPEVTFVLDHCGKPPIGGEGEAAWRRELPLLSAMPNVFCKLSGLGTEIVAGEVSAERTRPVLEHALETFGAERCLFGSDWPICTLAFPLSDWVETVREVVAPGGREALDAVFHATATRCYGLAVPGRDREASDG
jgi:L-fuconolactonase